MDDETSSHAAGCELWGAWWVEPCRSGVFFDRLANWYPPLSRLDSIKLSSIKVMDFLGPKECWTFWLRALKFCFGTHRWIWWICRSRNLMRASRQDKSLYHIQSLDEFLTLDYGRAPYDVWIEASNSTYKRLLKVLVNWIALSRMVISRIYCNGLKKRRFYCWKLSILFQRCLLFMMVPFLTYLWSIPIPEIEYFCGGNDIAERLRRIQTLFNSMLTVSNLLSR